MARQGAASMFATALLLGVFANIAPSVESVGVSYGMSGDNLPPASTVVGMYKSNGISLMRIYAPDQAALKAVSGTGIRVVVGAPNDVLSSLAASPAAAASWVRNNIAAYPDVTFRCVCVGNEVAGGAARDLVPAMENIRAALAAAGLDGIKVTTSVSQAILGGYKPPSEADFTDEAQAFMGPVLAFLARTGAPLMASVYPYFTYATNPSAMDLAFALFTAPGTVLQDGDYGYQNLFDATVDSFYVAMANHGGAGVTLVVSESGWPSAGGVAASPENAATYNQNLVNHVGRGTPRHPGAIETILFSMFNENLKEDGVEQNWGLFYPNMQRVYLLTPKIGTRKRLTCGPDLVEGRHSAKGVSLRHSAKMLCGRERTVIRLKSFFWSIRQGYSAVGKTSSFGRGTVPHAKAVAIGKA